MNSSHHLKAIGIQTWQRRNSDCITTVDVSHPQAKLMIIGEATSGSSEQLLNAMIQSINLNRSDVYIANSLNHDFLNQQISLVQPRLLLVVGEIASHYLLNTKSSIESMRNTIHSYGENNIPLMVTYDPAYLLNNPIAKKKAYVDLLTVKKTLSNQ
jgi:uracil-DNA glycosylase